MKTIIAVFAFVMSLFLIAEARATYPVPVAPVYRIRRAVDLLDNGRVQRQAGGGGGGHHDVVDFGAHTGHHGAFGWYADFPVHAHAN